MVDKSIKDQLFKSTTSYGDNLKSFMDLVQQQTAGDAFADVFTNQAKDMSSVGAMNQAAKGVLGSIGGSLKGIENEKKQEKLDPLLEMAGQITAKSAELEAQTQGEDQRKLAGSNLMKSQISLLTNLGRSTIAGDVNSSTQQAKVFGEKYQEAFDTDLGEFDSYDLDRRRIYYKDRETGGITGYDMADEIREYAEAAYGDKAPLIMQNFDPYYKEQYENTKTMQQLKMEGERLDNRVKSSHANFYDAQTETTAYKMNTPEVNKHVTEKTFDTNVKWMDEQEKIVDNAILKNKVFDKLEAILKRESAAGGTPLDAIYRYYKGKTGNDKDLTEAKLLQKYFFADIKGVAGNPNNKEWTDLVSRIISTEQNVEGALSVLNFEKSINNEAIERYHDTVDELQTNDYGLLYNDPRIRAKVKEKATQNNASPQDQGHSQSGIVLMTNPATGEQFEVPSSKVELFKENGYE